MKKEIIQKGVILPLIIGVVIAVVFFAFLHSTDMFRIVSDGAVIAYHDSADASAELVRRDNPSDYCANDLIGNISCGGVDTPVRYMADYAHTTGAFSLEKGYVIGKGVACISANYAIASVLEENKSFAYSGSFGDYEYKLVSTKDYHGEKAVLYDNQDISDGVVVYYQLRAGGGLSTDYRALVFEEVQ